MNPYILWFNEINMDDLAKVGGKNASLGEMYQELSQKGVKVPNGFAITVEGYNYFLTANNLTAYIEDQLAKLNPEDISQLRKTGQAIRQKILSSPFPEDLRDQVLDAYRNLTRESQTSDVAVRSSATAEDLPTASFAGQQETYLNVHGDKALIESCKKCFASLFTNRAISYRASRNFIHMEIGLSIGIQRMVRSDLATAGVLFTLDTESGFRDVVLINAAYGLGENVVKGNVNPDEYYVFKPTLKQGFKPIIQKVLGSKELKMIYTSNSADSTENVRVEKEKQDQFALSDEDILTLSQWGVLIEDHYSSKNSRPSPMDIEWAKDGRTGEVFVVQARPETVQSQKPVDVIETYRLKKRGKILAQGRSVGSQIRSGVARVIHDISDLHLLEKGEILVTERTDPDWEPVMKKAGAIVTDRGGRTCHAAIVSRELGLPAIVGADKATEKIKTGQVITVSCAEGENGFIYEGELPFEVEKIQVSRQKRPETKVMMNIANPGEAFKLSFLPNDGVGLAREEFIVNDYIKVHPLALLKPEKISDSKTKTMINELTRGFSDKSQYFVSKLAEGVAMIAAAFYPKPVIVRLSDFKTNEYAHLLGGEAFEPKEENPMIGFRGASRYYHKSYKEAFGLECQALKKVRDEMGLTNLKIMVPFCRTVEEAKLVQAEMASHGLRRKENSLELYMMCEIPSNVVLADRFAKYFDGFSIGSNDLTQLVLGVDRDSEMISHLFDERDLAVKRMILQVIRCAHRYKRKIGICGQAPSDYPEFADFLVAAGIDSMSLNPDVVIKTTQQVLQTEAKSMAEREQSTSVPPGNQLKTAHRDQSFASDNEGHYDIDGVSYSRNEVIVASDVLWEHLL